MYSNDTICALATAPGVAGLAVIRVSGPQAFQIVDSLFSGKTKISNANSHTILYGQLKLEDDIIDSVTVSVFRAPHSYTGEDVVEIGCHGGFIIPDLVVRTLLAHGVRSARAGEFTQRAFLNGKMDLTQVESVADIIHSSSTASARVSSKQLFGSFRDTVKQLRSDLIKICSLLELELDFSQENLELVQRQTVIDLLQSSISLCQRISSGFQNSITLRSGCNVTLVGKPNAGKSMLFNELLNWKRSIVHSEEGTTRDYIKESVLWDGLRLTFFDTAGLRKTDDIVENAGVLLTGSLMSESHLILIVNDSSAGAHNSDAILEDLSRTLPLIPVILIQNKIDLISELDVSIEQFSGEADYKIPEYHISVKDRVGIDDLKAKILWFAKTATDVSGDALLNQRHLELLQSASQSMSDAAVAFENGSFAEEVAFEIRKAIETLGELSGESFNEEVLNSIFANFCIGK